MSNSNVQGSGFVDNAELGTRNSESTIDYPFAAVAGHETAKHALLLLAVDPELRGALIASDGGSAESVLTRSFASISFAQRTQRLAKTQRATSASTQGDRFDTQMIEVPLGVTEDRLLGGLDLERTLATGKRQVSPGLLSKADARVLCIDSINLLEPGIAIHLAHALEAREVFVERESVSATHSADFVLVATFNPAEGEPSSLLSDRVGLIVESSGDASPEIGAEIIERDFRFENDPAGFGEDFAFETAHILSAIDAGRAQLPRVKVSKERRQQIAHIAMRLGVEGNRADLFALKAARANAALGGRDSIADEDMVVAIRLVLAPRAKTLPPEKEAAPSEVEDVRDSQSEDRVDSSPKVNEDGVRNGISDGIEDVIIAAIDARAPKDLLAIEQTRSRSSRSGKRFKGSPSIRGRYVRSDPRRISDARISIDATLRAAAPFQRLRIDAGSPTTSLADDVESQPTKRRGRRVKIHPSDLRYKRFKDRSGIMFIFAVDASGSMALNRMAQAKGALTRLLGGAYLHRDKVALVSFRGEGSKILLAPTRSVELAKRLVDAMPAGGGTPVSAGVLKALELARLSRLQGMSQAMLVLFTDGRANVGLDPGRAIEGELKQLGALLRAEGIASVIVDTKARFLSNGEGIALAEMLGSRYLFLPRADTTSIGDAIASSAARPLRING